VGGEPRKSLHFPRNCDYLKTLRCTRLSILRLQRH